EPGSRRHGDRGPVPRPGRPGPVRVDPRLRRHAVAGESACRLLRRTGLEAARRRGQRHDDRLGQRPAAPPRYTKVRLPGTGPGPATPRPASPAPAPPRPRAATQPTAAPSRLLVTLCYRDRPFDPAFTSFFESEARPRLAAAGAAPLAWLQTEYAENTFPALPVRTGEHVFAWLARFPSQDQLDAHLRAPAPAPALAGMITREPQRLRL